MAFLQRQSPRDFQLGDAPVGRRFLWRLYRRGGFWRVVRPRVPAAILEDRGRRRARRRSRAKRGEARLFRRRLRLRQAHLVVPGRGVSKPLEPPSHRRALEHTDSPGAGLRVPGHARDFRDSLVAHPPESL